MRMRTMTMIAAGALALGAWAGPVAAAGLLTPVGGGVPPLELKDHLVEVVVEDGYAVTIVEQRFHNPHPRDLEALYAFPVPEAAAVSEFTYWIDGRPVTGEVLPKQQARTVYEEEKAAGRATALTEQDGHRDFEIRVTPVRAGDEVRIRLGYIQPARLDTGVGRYVYPLAEGNVDEAANAFWHMNDQVTGRFRFALTLRLAAPVSAVRLPAHPDAEIRRRGDGWFTVTLGDPPTPNDDRPRDHADAALVPAALPAATRSPAPISGSPRRLDTDIVVYWRLAEGQPGQVELVTHKPDAEGEGTFMLVVTPGDDLAPIDRGTDWTFVLDRSGSMRDGKIAHLRDGVRQALARLGARDRVRLIAFNNAAQDLSGGLVPATPAVVRQLDALVGQIGADGGTNLYDGLRLAQEGTDADRTSAILLVTDGVANVGETEQRAFLDLVRQRDIRLFTFIMGNGANRPLLAALTEATNGHAVGVSTADDIVGVLLGALGKVGHQAFHDVALALDGIETFDVVPDPIGSIYRGEQLVVFGRYRGAGMADLTVRGRVSGRPVEYRTRFAVPATATRNPELERLWAFARVEAAMTEIHTFGETPDRRAAVEALAVAHGLVTPYTSMLVVEEDVFAERGLARTTAERVADEQAARAARAAGPVVAHRVDQAAPAFASAQPSYGGGAGAGGGNVGLLGLLASAALGWAGMRARRS